eukprot:15354021-Ditylum_brightwellii.AAC.3
MSNLAKAKGAGLAFTMVATRHLGSSLVDTWLLPWLCPMFTTVSQAPKQGILQEEARDKVVQDKATQPHQTHGLTYGFFVGDFGWNICGVLGSMNCLHGSFLHDEGCSLWLMCD